MRCSACPNEFLTADARELGIENPVYFRLVDMAPVMGWLTIDLFSRTTVTLSKPISKSIKPVARYWIEPMCNQLL